MEIIMNALQNYAIYFGYSLIAIALLVVMKYALNYKAKDYYTADDELNAGNWGVAFRRAGVYLGLGIAIMGVMYGDAQGSLIDDIKGTVLYGGLGVLYMIIALVIADKVLLSGMDNKEALRDGNVSVGLVEMGALIATGIIASASIRLDGGQYYVSLAYFAVGQVLLLFIMKMYGLRLAQIVNGNGVESAIKNDNKSVALYIAGKFIAYSLLLHATIYNLNPAASVGVQATELAIGLVCAVGLMAVIEILADWFVMTNVTVKEALTNDMSTQILQLVSIKVVLALVIAFTLL